MSLLLDPFLLMRHVRRANKKTGNSLTDEMFLNMSHFKFILLALNILSCDRKIFFKCHSPVCSSSSARSLEQLSLTDIHILYTPPPPSACTALVLFFTFCACNVYIVDKFICYLVTNLYRWLWSFVTLFFMLQFCVVDLNCFYSDYPSKFIL